VDLILQTDGQWDVAAPVSKLIPTADPTRRVEAKGTIAPDDLQIFLDQKVLTEIVDYSRLSLAREVGGVLPGTVYEDRGVPYIEIAGYITAPGESEAARFTFTHEAWSKISRERERRFEDRPLVGWHHTHPGYGVFLSEYDRFIHRHFFNLPWMVALVVDPRAETLSFFQWKRDRIEPVGFYFVR
jgi:proteasome lid subunit RPN8/RPN11